MAKTTKAKRRIFEIVLGVIAYLVLYAILQFLIPGGFAHKEQIPVESISISLQNSSVYVGETTNANVTFTPENASNKTYSLYSSNNSVATASFGSVRCLKSGSATITALSSNNLNSTTTISCVTKPSYSGGGSGGSGGSGGGSSQSFVEGSCDIDEMSGPRLAVTTRPVSEAEVEKCGFSQDPTYEEIVELFKQYGITENSDQFYAVIGWTQQEGYWAAYKHPDPYLGYLSACVLLNNVRADKNYIETMEKWGYTKSLLKQNTQYVKNNNYLPTLKSLYLALKYPYPKINQCWGNSGKVPEHLVYTGLNNSDQKIYVFWGN